MKIYVGIDGGGTKTQCAVGNETGVLGRFVTGTCKLQKVGKAAAAAALQTGIRGALSAANCDASSVSDTCIGIAGESHPEVIDLVKQAIGAVLPGSITVVGDEIIGLEAAFFGGPGTLVIAGTGSNTYGRNERGETARAGGWGPIVSDEGSGEWIGRAAVRAMLLAIDAGKEPVLFGQIAKAWGVSTRDEIVTVANASPPPQFAGLFPLVLSAAQAGDPLAAELLDRAGRELGKVALIVVKRLWPEGAPVQIAGVGGVMEHCKQVREGLQSTIRAERPNATYLDREVDPVLGALYIAREAKAAATV